MKRNLAAKYIYMAGFFLVLAGLSACAPGDCDGKDSDNKNPFLPDYVWTESCDQDLYLLRQRLEGCGAADTAVAILKERFEPCTWVEMEDRPEIRCLIDCFSSQPDSCDLLLYTFDSCLCEEQCGLSCDRQCEEGGFQCDDGHCLPFYAECDFYDDCLDGSDEIGACQAKCIDMGGFICDDSSCVPPDFECDFFFDCPDGSDEHQGCIDDCVAAGGFVCDDGFCVPADWRCDGLNDCPDWSDESGCE